MNRSMALVRVGAALVLSLAVAGCTRREPAPAETGQPRALPVAVYADTGRTTTLRVAPPADTAAARPSAAVWLASVSPARAEPAALTSPEPAAEAPADSLAFDPPPSLVVDGHLKPPLLRAEAPLAVPRGARGSVELDVRVDERGDVADVRWAGGTRDPAMVAAASDCARAMRFFPAERAGVPVAVWCRQRFDFGAEAH